MRSGAYNAWPGLCAPRSGTSPAPRAPPLPMDAREKVLHGPVVPTILALAGPVIAGEAIHTAFHMVDMAWVGPLGAWATGAIATSMFTLWLGFACANMVCTGLVAHVSRAIGAGDRTLAGRAVAQGLLLALGLGCVMAVAGALGASHLFALVGTDPRTSAAGAAYLRTVLLGSPAAFLYLACGAVMRACGNTRTPLYVTASALAGNALLAPFLIFGWGPFPELSVMGSGVATVICMAGAVVAYAALIARGHHDLPLHRASLRRPDPTTMLSIARVGAPVAAVSALFSLVYLWYAHLASSFGDAALAVLGIGNRLESLTYLSADGFAVATATFVGQNLGAGNPTRAEHGAWRATGIMTVGGGLLTLLFLAFPAQLLDVFTNDPAAIALGVPYMRVLGICQIFTALEGVLSGGFAGAGDTVPPMTVHVAFALLRLPLALWAVRDLGLGPVGIAWVISLTCIVRATILAAWFRRGHWKSRMLPATVAAVVP